MRPEKLYLRDILEATDAIAQYVTGITRQAFLDDDRSRSATVYKLIIIGEAAAQLSEGLRKRHPSIPWSDIVGLRNIAVHAYHNLQWDIVWATATQEVPRLRAQMLAILESEYPGDG